jgi:hypothetical protein
MIIDKRTNGNQKMPMRKPEDTNGGNQKISMGKPEDTNGETRRY